MDITRFFPDDADAVTEVVALLNAATDIDKPDALHDTPAAYAGAIRYGWDGEVPETYVVRTDDGRAVGLLEVETTEWDNTHLAWLSVVVHPEHRRRGIGSDLHDFGAERARTLGRRSVGIDGWDSPGVHAFAAAHGFDAKSVEVRRRQEFDRLDLGVVAKHHDEAAEAASDYDLIRLFGRTPEAMLDDMAELTGAINDAPTDDLDIEDEVFSRERIEAFETAMLGRDRRLYRVLARHRATGELAGHTVVSVEAERPEMAFQLDTSVVRSHRGHRLGLLLKADMVLWLGEDEPGLRTLDTWNAASNDHMIAVNEALGYRIIGRNIQFQRNLD